jgi:hypothetical protein
MVFLNDLQVAMGAFLLLGPLSGLLVAWFSSPLYARVPAADCAWPDLANCGGMGWRNDHEVM